ARAGPAASHLELHDRPNLDRALSAVECRAALGELGGLGEIPGLDDRVAADHVFRLDEGPVGDRLGAAAHQLSRAIERLPGVLQVPFAFEVAHPRHPALHALLALLGGAHRRLACGGGVTIEKDEVAHRCLALKVMVRYDNVRGGRFRTQPWSLPPSVGGPHYYGVPVARVKAPMYARRRLRFGGMMILAWIASLSARQAP